MNPRRILGLALLSAVGAAFALAADSPSLWIDVPFIAQSKNGCGSASIAMVMEYWNTKLRHTPVTVPDAAAIQQDLYSPSQQGVPASSMIQYFEHSGYRAFAFAGDFPELQHHLARGRPLIVALRASGPFGPLHYVVVVGIDPALGYVYVNDPAQQKMLRISREGFESEWQATHHWTLLAVPRSGD